MIGLVGGLCGCGCGWWPACEGMGWVADLGHDLLEGRGQGLEWTRGAAGGTVGALLLRLPTHQIAEGDTAVCEWACPMRGVVHRVVARCVCCCV